MMTGRVRAGSAVFRQKSTRASSASLGNVTATPTLCSTLLLLLLLSSAWLASMLAVQQWTPRQE